MIGPPGSGKSMVAKRIPTIMPAPTLEEHLEVLSIHSAAGRTIAKDPTLWTTRPFRAPHHTVSDIALLGGGSIPGPGEISLAHHGVLFLDELPEFKRGALEVLRQPLEDGQVTISRSAGKVTLPCAFMLVAAMNPCPCGYLGDPKHECRCTPDPDPALSRARQRTLCSTASTCTSRPPRSPLRNCAPRPRANPPPRCAPGSRPPMAASTSASRAQRPRSTPA